MIAKAWWNLRYAAWCVILAPVAVGVRAGLWREPGQPPRHTRDLFGRAGATTSGGTFTGALITCLDSDWPTAKELEDAEWECLWRSLDNLLAREAHDGNLRLVAAGIPLHVIAEHSVAEVQRHERALAVAEDLTGERPALVGAS